MACWRVSEAAGAGFVRRHQRTLNGALQVRTILVQAQDFETPAAPGEDIHAPVGILRAICLSTVGRAARVEQSFIRGEHHAELDLLLQHLPDHFFVAIFEDVQGQFRPGEPARACRGRQRHPIAHVTIITFASHDTEIEN